MTNIEDKELEMIAGGAGADDRLGHHIDLVISGLKSLITRYVNDTELLESVTPLIDIAKKAKFSFNYAKMDAVHLDEVRETLKVLEAQMQNIPAEYSDHSEVIRAKQHIKNALLRL